MFSRIEGIVLERAGEVVRVDAGALAYDIVLPPSVAFKVSDSGPVTLEIYAHFALDGNAGRFTFFGFTNGIEREFSAPMARIARAIDEGDHVFLKTLPGIGQQKARDIVAKLQGKVARFLLIQDAPQREVPDKT